MTVIERTGAPPAPAPRGAEQGRCRPILHGASALLASAILAQVLAPLALREVLGWHHTPVLATLTSAALLAALFAILDRAFRGSTPGRRGAHALFGVAHAGVWFLAWGAATSDSFRVWLPGDALLMPGLVAGLAVQAMVLITYRGRMRTLGRFELAAALGLLLAFVTLQP